MPVNILFLYPIYAKVVNLLQISVNDTKHFAEKKPSIFGHIFLIFDFAIVLRFLSQVCACFCHRGNIHD